MNFMDLPAGAIRAFAHGIRITEDLEIEWKAGLANMATAELVEVDGARCIRIVTGKQKGWVRLHLVVRPDADPVLGGRFVLRIARSGTEPKIKPHVVQSNLNNGSRSVVSAFPANWLSLRLQQWYDVAGSMICGHEVAGRRIDLALDLPLDSEILLADVSAERFAASVSKDQASNLARDLIAPLQPFGRREISGVTGCLATPAVYYSKVSVAPAAMSGIVLTHAPALYLKSDPQGEALEMPLERSADVSGVTLARGGFDVSLPNARAKDGQLLAMTSKDTTDAFWSGSRQTTAMSATPEKAEWPRTRQDQVVLLWVPISTAGLTVQLEQVTKILDKLRINYRISYHIRPRIDHPLCKYWVEPRDIDRPKLVIYFERFVEFDRGFDEAFKVFYMNLDWLSEKTLSIARTHAKVVLCPTPYRLEELGETFRNSKVIHLPWPSQFTVRKAAVRSDKSQPIRVLYVGNDFDELSRKHPYQVVEAIERVEREDILFDLKFRAPLPPEVRARLSQNPRVASIIDWSTEHSVVEEMYKQADINLIPNACEGNGLSILESWASGTVPAVLNGHPMIDVTSEENSYRIACEQDGNQEYAPYYRTGSDELVAFLNGLDRDDVAQKKAFVRDMAEGLVDRQKALEKAILSFVMMSGIRTRGLRLRVEEAHLPSKKYPHWTERSGERVRDLMFSDEGQRSFARTPQLIDVLLTTSRRPWCLRESLAQLMRAIRLSPFKHRLFLAVDTIDPGTMNIIGQYASEIDQVLWTREQHGLPYTWNSLNGMLRNTINRTELKPDYVCYIQDDCYIKDPANYFTTMVGIAHESMPGYLGFVSGFYTEVHPGFADFEWKGNRVIASDSIDGKNFMASPEVLASTGALTWWFKDGMRRGNPGPVRGSHFDLWQWKESPNSLLSQSRISLVLPDLCDHIAERSEDSTWNNDTTDAATRKRIDAEKVYKTRSYEA